MVSSCMAALISCFSSVASWTWGLLCRIGRVVLVLFLWLARKMAASKFWGYKFWWYSFGTKFKLIKALVMGVCLNGVDVVTDIYTGIILLM